MEPRDGEVGSALWRRARAARRRLALAQIETEHCDVVWEHARLERALAENGLVLAARDGLADAVRRLGAAIEHARKLADGGQE